MVDDTLSDRRPRVRRSIRRVVYWLGPVLLLIAAWQSWDAIEARRLERAADGLPGGLPRNIAIPFSADPRRVPGQMDAAAYYAAANIAAVTIGFVTRSERPFYSEVVAAYRESLLEGTDVPMSAREAASRYLARYELPLRLTRDAADLPYGGSAPGPESAYRFSGLITVSSLTRLRTLAAIASDDTDAAFALLIARMQLVRTYADRPPIWYGIAIAQEAEALAADTGILLSRTNLSDDQLQALDQGFGTVTSGASLEGMVTTLVSERLRTLEAIWSGRRVTGGAFQWLARPVLRHHATALVQVAGDAVAVSRLPWPKREAAMTEIDGRRSIVPEAVPFIGAWRIVPQLADLTASMAGAVAASRSARIAIAVERHRRQTKGLPSALNELIPPLQSEEKEDPFTGAPLEYVSSGDGYVVYSVGSDRRDDGGELTPDLPNGRMPGTLPAPDIGVRVSDRR